ncbi:MAG: nucleoside recognition domain-containing protein, partial [Desulfovibrionales bacterium]|nr:nucleoside recognition domain-containing protein [Desulfovibrionales bacterium]
ANAMLLEFYKEEKITKSQLFLSNFVNQFPAYFLHLPTTFFIVLPLTGKAGVIYFALTFAAVLVRCAAFLIYGHFFLAPASPVAEIPASKKTEKPGVAEVLAGIRRKLPARVINIAVFVLPVYIAVFLVNRAGGFTAANEWVASVMTTSFMPVEALSVVILSFAAEFTSGFAAAGALLSAGAITVKQTALALIFGNILAFPIRALRHQLPRYMGIFSPRMGTQLLLLGQFFRVISLIFVTLIYYWFF